MNEGVWKKKGDESQNLIYYIPPNKVIKGNLNSVFLNHSTPTILKIRISGGFGVIIS